MIFHMLVVDDEHDYGIIARLQHISLHARPLIQDLAKLDVDWSSGHSFCRCIAHCGMLISGPFNGALNPPG